MRKKIFSVLLIGLFAFLMCGCTANVGYGIVFEPTDAGTYGITQMLYVTIDKASIENAGKTKEQFKQKFEKLANEYIEYCDLFFNTKCDIEIENELEMGYSQKIKNLAGDEVTATQFKNYVRSHKEQQKFAVAEDDKRYQVAVSQYFESAFVFKCYWGMIADGDGSDQNDGEVIDETFIKKTMYTQHTVFHGLTEENYNNLDALTKSIINQIEQFFGGQYNLDNRDLTYTYDFATPQTHFYTDADTIATDSKGNTVYSWHFSSADLKNEDGDKITEWTVAYHTANWYQLAIYLTVIFGVGLLLVATIAGKSNKLRNKN